MTVAALLAVVVAAPVPVADAEDEELDIIEDAALLLAPDVVEFEVIDEEVPAEPLLPVPDIAEVEGPEEDIAEDVPPVPEISEVDAIEEEEDMAEDMLLDPVLPVAAVEDPEAIEEDAVFVAAGVEDPEAAELDPMLPVVEAEEPD